jgi:glycosyltransferase involved in cell wall biosynthesis
LNKNNQILVINPYGSLPSEGWREYRTFVVAKELAKSNSSVLWLISDYIHNTKEIRKQKGLRTYSDVVIYVLSNPFRYQKHASFGRLLYEFFYGIQCSIYIIKKRQSINRLILSEPGLPYTWFLCLLSLLMGIRVSVDVIDLWPEHLASLNLSRSFAGSLALKVLLFICKIQRSLIARCAHSIIAVSKTYAYAYILCLPAKSSEKVFVIPIGIDVDKFRLQSSAKSENLSIVDGLQHFLSSSLLTVVYSGSFGVAYDIKNLCLNVQNILRFDANIKFLFLGTGPLDDYPKDLSMRYPDFVFYAGKVPECTLPLIYRYCSIGICSYAKGSAVSLPLKYFDYLAAGLAIVSNLESELSDEIRSWNVGIQYSSDKPESFADALLLLSRDRQKLSSLQRNSHARAMSYDQRSLMEEYSKILN